MDFKSLVEQFDSMKFLIPTVPGPKVNQSKMKTYRVVGTDLCFHVLRGGRDGNQVLIEYLDPYHEEPFVKNFEEFFEKLPQGAKEELVFHLDIFKSKSRVT